MYCACVSKYKHRFLFQLSLHSVNVPYRLFGTFSHGRHIDLGHCFISVHRALINLFYGCILFHCKCTLTYLTVPSWWAFRSPLIFCYYKQCCLGSSWWDVISHVWVILQGRPSKWKWWVKEFVISPWAEREDLRCSLLFIGLGFMPSFFPYLNIYS